MEVIKNSFNQDFEYLSSKDYKPEKTDFLTVSSCKNVLKKLLEKEKCNSNSSINNSVSIGRAFERLKNLRRLKASKLSHFAKEECNLVFAQSYIYFCMKLYKLSLFYPQILSCNLSVYFLKKHFNYFEDYLINQASTSTESTGLTQEFGDVQM